MDDLISRQAAIKAIIAEGRDVDSRYLESERIIHETDAVEAIAMLPSAQPESRRAWYMHGYRDAQNAAMHESCTDCPLYDHDKHNCPRFNKVIPRAIEEAKPRWIPVTPDSPPCYMPVLTWDGETRHVEQRIPYVRDESGEKIISDWWIDGDEKWDEWAEYQPNIRDGCAIKWMPLPEPYKGGQDEQITTRYGSEN